MPKALRPMALAAAAIALAALPRIAVFETHAGDPVLPKELIQARYVVLGFDVGDAFVAESAPDDRRVSPDDRRKLAALRAEFARWGRYKVVVQPGQAELFVTIRTGHAVAAGGGGSVGGRPPGTPGGSVRLEAGSSEDALFVYRSGSLGTPLWRGQRSGGLDGSPPALFERFRSEVERGASKP